MKIGIFGRGRLGSAIASAACEQIAWQIGRDGTPGANADVAIDASSSEAVPAHVNWAIETRTPLVIGTTGWSIPDMATRVDGRIGVLVAPNFSLAIALMNRMATVLARFASQDRSRDLYLLEHHHKSKHDAPSGTAKMLAATLLANCPRKTEWTIGGPLEEQQLSVGVLRAGSTYSSHVIGVDSPAEVIEIRHEARSAAAFASGALAAAEWLIGKQGVFTFADMAADIIDPLFRNEER